MNTIKRIVTFFSLLLTGSSAGHSIDKTENSQTYGKWYARELESPATSSPIKISKTPYTITSEDLNDLKEYIKDTQFSGVIFISDEKASYKICSQKFEGVADDELIFGIHSIGKVHTGILTLLLVREGIFEESQLSAQLQLDSNSLKALPLSVQNQVKVATLHDTMIHKGGFGDYLKKYIASIQDALANQTAPKIIQNPEDFLTFAEDDIFELKPGESRYSNVGYLLVGLTVQHYYQKVEPIDYNAILKKHLLDTAGITHFYVSKPAQGKFNETDPVAPYLSGSPAGGYWMSLKELHTFGLWIRKICKEDPFFMQLVEKYGQEFYSNENKEISHGGRISSSSTMFSVCLDNGLTIAIASDKPTPQSPQIYKAIVRNLVLAKP